jgi:CHRD domain
MLKPSLLKLCLLAGTTTFAIAQGPGHGQFKTAVNGYNEVPAVVTTGTGQATVTVSSDQKSLSVTLNLTNLVGMPQSAGLYLALSGTTGGLIAPICAGATCPATTSGKVTITITDADIAGIPAQGLAANDLATVINALTTGAVYVNVITDKFPTGEIRGQFGGGFDFGPGIGGGRGR